MDLLKTYYPENYDVLNTKVVLPNVKKLFKPDPGWVICDTDLAQADAQVVAAEADDSELRDIFDDPTRDLHNENAQAIFGGKHYPAGTEHPKRQIAKGGVHAVNYMVAARTLAATLGITVHEAEQFIAKWLSAHPGIADWHKRIRYELNTRRYIENRFGNRRTFLGRLDRHNIINEALAWIPQSTVGLIINRAWINLENEFSDDQLQVLLQVHDSLVFQVPYVNSKEVFTQLKKHLLIPVPYDPPLIIDVGLEVSEDDWGSVKKLDWNDYNEEAQC